MEEACIPALSSVVHFVASWDPGSKDANYMYEKLGEMSIP